MRVGRQWFSGAALLNEATDLRSAVRLEIVQQHDIAALHPGREPAPHPVDERGVVRCAPHPVKGNPAAAAFPPLAPEPQQPSAAWAANALSIAIHRVPRLGVLLRVPPTTIRFGDLTAQAHRLEVDQR